MSNIDIWNGVAGAISGSTPFGFYDSDTTFQADGPKVARFCTTRLGWPIVDVELQSGSIYACFEEAITTYGNEVYLWKIRENYLGLEGGSTGSALNNQLINQGNIGSIIRMAENYGAEVGTGGNINWYTGSIGLIPGVQDYDLKPWAIASASLDPSDNIEVKRVFFQGPPAIVRFFDPYAGTGMGSQAMLESFGFGGFSPGINFMLMPLYFDIEKIQAIELNDQVRKSAYSFELVNNVLRVFPIPRDSGRLRFEYIKKSERNNPINSNTSGSGLITNVSNVPYNNPTYAFINAVGRQWIYEYTLALVKEQLAYVRGKFSSIPIPNAETTLNQGDLLTDARAEKLDLLTQLRGALEATSRTSQLKSRNEEVDAMKNVLLQVPTLIYIG